MDFQERRDTGRFDSRPRRRIKQGHLDNKTLQLALARQAGLEMVDLTQVKFTSDLLERIDANTARSYGIIPVRQEPAG